MSTAVGEPGRPVRLCSSIDPDGPGGRCATARQPLCDGVTLACPVCDGVAGKGSAVANAAAWMGRENGDG